MRGAADNLQGIRSNGRNHSAERNAPFDAPGPALPIPGGSIRRCHTLERPVATDQPIDGPVRSSGRHPWRHPTDGPPARWAMTAPAGASSAEHVLFRPSEHFPCVRATPMGILLQPKHQPAELRSAPGLEPGLLSARVSALTDALKEGIQR